MHIITLSTIAILLISNVYGQGDKLATDLEVEQSNSNPVVKNIIINDPSNQSCKAECDFKKKF